MRIALAKIIKYLSMKT